MKVERLEIFDQFQRLRTDWNDVYSRDPEAQFFLSWIWLAGVLDNHPGQWTVLACRDCCGKCLGFLPLRRKTVWSNTRKRLRNEFHFAGRLFWADYGGLLCLPEHEERVVTGFASHLMQMHWSHIYLKGFRISDRRYDLFINAFRDERVSIESLTSVINDGHTNNLICPYIDLPTTFEAYLSDRLSGNTRQKIRRFLRRVDSSSEYAVTQTSAETKSRDVRILEELWRKMWLAQKGSETRRLSTTYGRIVSRGLDDNLVHMLVMWREHTAVGVLASFVDWEKSRLLFFVAGRDPAITELPIGLLLHAHSIRWAIQNGIRTYDFLRGDEPYKYSLGAVNAHLKYPLIRTRSGHNLNHKLDPGSVETALQITVDFATNGRRDEAVTACRQVLAISAAEPQARRLIEALADDAPISNSSP